MKYMEHEGYQYEHNGRIITITNLWSGETMTLSRHVLKTALDFSEDIEE
jgi:hypothetical protein